MSAELPVVFSLRDFLARELVRPPTLIQDVIAKGDRMILAGPSKAGKSWLLMGMGIRIARGTSWFGLNFTQARVLHIDIELTEDEIQDRFNKVVGKDPPPENYDLISLRNQEWEDNPHRFVERLIALCRQKSYDVICLDPLYRMMGSSSESDEVAVKDLLKALRQLNRETGAALVIVHHFPKGNPGSRMKLDRVAGSGIWTRDMDAVMTLTPHGHPHCFVLDVTTRRFKEWKPIVLLRSLPDFIHQPHLNPNDLAKRAGAERKFAPTAILDCLKGSMTHGEWLAKCRDTMGMSKSAFELQLKALKQEGLVGQEGRKYFLPKPGKA